MEQQIIAVPIIHGTAENFWNESELSNAVDSFKEV